MNALIAPGFFGKVPTHGDFVSRRLPREFRDPWDEWLQAGITASREQLGELWPEAYRRAPVWRFGIGPGLCGPRAWAGVVIPSVDKVERCFPLALAAPMANAKALLSLFGSAAGQAWLARLEQLALSAHAGDFSLDEFDQYLQAETMPGPIDGSALRAMPDTPAGAAAKLARHIRMKSLEQLPAALLELDAAALSRLLPTFSLWATRGSAHIDPALLLVEGLPPIAAYTVLLTGRWSEAGQGIASTELQAPGADETLPIVREPADLPPSPETPPMENRFDSDAPTIPLKAARPWLWRSWGECVTGKRRELNEDAKVERPAAGLWAVADGMGGHQAGEVASGTIQQVLEGVEASADLPEFVRRIEQALQEANRQLRHLAAAGGEADQIIGSTVVVLAAVENRCVFLWAGDSRLYRFRDGNLEQLTQDHSLFEEFIRQGVFTAEQLAQTGRCDVITRAVGVDDTLKLDRGECEAQAGDMYLLCSDGLDKELAREDIEAVLRETAREDVVGVLIEQAEARGARDNVTVVVAELSAP